MNNVIENIKSNVEQMNALVDKGRKVFEEHRTTKRLANEKGEIDFVNTQSYQITNIVYNQYVGALMGLEYCLELLTNSASANKVLDSITLKIKYWQRKAKLSGMMINTYEGEVVNKYRIVDHVSSRGNLERGIVGALEHVTELINKEND